MQTSKNRIERPGFPVAFIGHGTPLNALDDNAFTRGWAALAAKLARPRAILSISAHWYTRGTAVTAMEGPERSTTLVITTFSIFLIQLRATRY
jgi:aromatic ring-opening dioxygenase catalytic subunit (LigB family)